MNPQEKSRKTASTEYEHPRMSLQVLVGREERGPSSLEQSQIRHQHHMYRMVLSGYTLLWGGSIFQKKQTQPCTTHSVQVSFLHMFSWGPESITCFFKNNALFEAVFMILFFPPGLASVEGFFSCFFFHVSFLFQFLI